MRTRYDIRFFSSTEEEGLIVWINDKLREYPTIKGVLKTSVTSEQANASIDLLTDALRHNIVLWVDLPYFISEWLNFLAENKLKEFTNSQN